MPTSKYIDYHIELSSLKDFANLLIERNLIFTLERDIILKCIINATISAEVKPFLTAPTDGIPNAYYDKYKRAESDKDKMIPDFFSSNGDFYDLERICNIYIQNTDDRSFRILFSLKLLEIESNDLTITDFLNFQLFDNFHGDKETLGNFLFHILNNENKLQLTPYITKKIKQWLNENHYFNYSNKDFDIDDELIKNEFLKIQIEENNLELDFDQSSKLKELKDFEIIGNFSLQEIRDFFSFLYKEKSCDKKPFLEENDVNEMFKNGFTIPAIPPTGKYKLNVDDRFPKKIIDYAIHLFYTKHSLKRRDKQNFIRFFGSYIEDYSKALNSNKELENITKNISGEKSSRSKIIFNNYLSEKFRI